MAETKPIPVRLEKDLLARLDAAAAATGVKRATLIRFCTITWLDYYERTKKEGLPAEWETMLAEADGRTREAREEIERRMGEARPTKYPPIKKPRQASSATPGMAAAAVKLRIRNKPDAG